MYLIMTTCTYRKKILFYIFATFHMWLNVVKFKVAGICLVPLFLVPPTFTARKIGSSWKCVPEWIPDRV